MGVTRILTLIAIAFLSMSSASARTGLAPDAVLVIGALHDLHERESAFRYEELKRAIVAFAPDVLVLEVRPDELGARKETPGRPEYPAVIWPLLAELPATTIAMEPDGKTFTSITSEAGAAVNAFRSRNPDGAAALSRLDEAAQELLLAHWRSPAHVHDDTTAELVRGLRAAQFALTGSAFAAAQSRWDAFMTDRAVDAVRRNSGKRVLVIGSYKNRFLLEGALRSAWPDRVIESSRWLGSMDRNAPVTKP